MALGSRSLFRNACKRAGVIDPGKRSHLYLYLALGSGHSSVPRVIPRAPHRRAGCLQEFPKSSIFLGSI